MLLLVETFRYLRQMFTILLILTHRFACSCICSICSRAVGLLHLNKHYLILSILHCYTQNMKALGLLVSEKSFYVFLIVSLWELMTPGAGPFLTPRGMVGRINKEDPYTLLHTNMKALGIAASEKIVLCFSHKAPGAGPVWTPGAWLAGFIEKKIFCYVFLIVSLWELSFGLETRVLI